MLYKLLGNEYGNLLNNITSNSGNLLTLTDIADAHAVLAEAADELRIETVPELDRLEQLKTKAQRALSEVLYRQLDQRILEAIPGTRGYRALGAA